MTKELEREQGNGVYYDLPDKIDVLLAGDKNVLKGMSLTMFSAVLKTEIPIRFHVMTTFARNTNGITQKDVDDILEKLKKVNDQTEIIYVDTKDDYDKWFSSSPNKDPKYSPCSLLRLFVSNYLTAKRVIYLDTDTMCYGSLTEFFKYDISDKEMAVVLDYLGKFWIKKDYFNSGVLFINMDRVKETKLFEKAIDCLTKEKLYFADQSALYNHSTQRLYIPMRFNEQRSVKPDTVVKHFNKGIKWLPFFQVYNVKQWQRDDVHKKLRIYEFDDVYAEYDKLFCENK